MDCIVHGVEKRGARLNDFHFLSFYSIVILSPCIYRKQTQNAQSTNLSRVPPLVDSDFKPLVLGPLVSVFLD